MITLQRYTRLWTNANILTFLTLLTTMTNKSPLTWQVKLTDFQRLVICAEETRFRFFQIKEPKLMRFACYYNGCDIYG